MRTFVLMSGRRETDRVFNDRMPRRAALRAAARGVRDIRLRERGTDRIHVFRGERRRVRARTGTSMVLTPVVRKLRIERTDRRRTERRARRTRRRAPARRRTARRARRRTVRRARRTRRRVRRTARRTRRARRR